VLAVAGVPIGDDSWVTNFVAEKVDAVILDVGKIDHVLTALFTIICCASARTRTRGFLARNTPTPLISESLGSFEST